MDDQRALLDMLMGKTRDLSTKDKGKLREITFHDPDVCKFFICGLCPYGLFNSTKSGILIDIHLSLYKYLIFLFIYRSWQVS